GVSILLISHKLEEIRAIFDRATILRGGRVTGDVDPREHDSHDLARMMIGRDMPAPISALGRSFSNAAERELATAFALDDEIFLMV
ncbi:ABC transporter ATP-binding protein, partial [Rhizobium ruizarguesonis]